MAQSTEDKIRDSVAQGEVAQLKLLLTAGTLRLSPDLRNESLLLLARLSALAKYGQYGLLSPAEASADRQRVFQAILDFLDEVKTRGEKLMGFSGAQPVVDGHDRDADRAALVERPENAPRQADVRPSEFAAKPSTTTRMDSAGRCRLLFLAANPAGTSSLALDEESRAIETKARSSEFRDSLEIVTKWAVRPDDLLQYMNQYRPHIVHFSGHGSPSEELLLQNATREAKPVSKAALHQLFTTLKDNVRVVVLNACYSRPQAEAITQVIDCAIGMKRAIGDQAAIVFAAAFYQAIGFGRTVQEAFDQGVTAILLEGIPEENTPELIVRPGASATEIRLISERARG